MLRRNFFSLLLAVGFATVAQAEHNGKIQILLLGDSTTEGSIPRLLKPEGPHLETVIAQLLAAERDLPPCQVINSSLSGEYIRRLLAGGRYEKKVAELPGIDYVFIRYGINDRARTKDFQTNFPKDFHELIARLRQDHPHSKIIPMTVIPFSSEAASQEINDLVRKVAQQERLPLFDIYPAYAAELKQGHNMLNYRRYPLSRVPVKFHAVVKPFIIRDHVCVMANELDALLGHLPGWYSDRHPNLAGYNVIARETAKYMAKELRK